ncbi:MAG: hypothetical protein RL340_1468, partial [Gemmatimonadota bacterium]
MRPLPLVALPIALALTGCLSRSPAVVVA